MDRHTILLIASAIAAVLFIGYMMLGGGSSTEVAVGLREVAVRKERTAKKSILETLMRDMQEDCCADAYRVRFYDAVE